MLIILPEWVTELEEKLDKVIKDLAAKNHIDILKINDSQTIANAKENISHVLVDLYWHYKVDERKMFEEFEKDMKRWENKKKTRRRTVRKKKSVTVRRVNRS